MADSKPCTLCGSYSDKLNECTSIFNDVMGFKVECGVDNILVCFICNRLIHNYYKFKCYCRRISDYMYDSLKKDSFLNLTIAKTLEIEAKEISDQHEKTQNSCTVYQHSECETNVESQSEFKLDFMKLDEIVDDESTSDAVSHNNDQLLDVPDKFLEGRDPLSNVSEDLADQSEDVATSERPGAENCFEQIKLTVEEQRRELDARRKSRGYIESEFKCHQCALGFTYLDSYQTHMVRHEESNGRFSCEICSLRFATQSARCMHITLHSTRYKCRLCGELLRSNAVSKHWECVGVNTSDKMCSQCGRMFKNPDSLRQHVRRAHNVTSDPAITSPSRYSCQHCPATYRQLHNLKAHTLSHTRVYTCSQCDRHYGTPYLLRRHEARHRPSAETPYCIQCDVLFKDTKNYRAHLKNSARHRTQENSEICAYCEYTCATRRDMYKHVERRHVLKRYDIMKQCRGVVNTGDVANTTDGASRRKVVCHTCGKLFSNRTVLKVHMKTHELKIHQELPAAEATVNFESTTTMN